MKVIFIQKMMKKAIDQIEKAKTHFFPLDWTMARPIQCTFSSHMCCACVCYFNIRMDAIVGVRMHGYKWVLLLLYRCCAQCELIVYWMCTQTTLYELFHIVVVMFPFVWVTGMKRLKRRNLKMVVGLLFVSFKRLLFMFSFYFFFKFSIHCCFSHCPNRKLIEFPLTWEFLCHLRSQIALVIGFSKRKTRARMSVCLKFSIVTLAYTYAYSGRVWIRNSKRIYSNNSISFHFTLLAATLFAFVLAFVSHSFVLFRGNNSLVRKVENGSVWMNRTSKFEYTNQNWSFMQISPSVYAIDLCCQYNVSANFACIAFLNFIRKRMNDMPAYLYFGSINFGNMMKYAVQSVRVIFHIQTKRALELRQRQLSTVTERETETTAEQQRSEEEEKLWKIIV